MSSFKKNQSDTVDVGKHRRFVMIYKSLVLFLKEHRTKIPVKKPLKRSKKRKA
jgi:hypothetical protein